MPKIELALETAMGNQIPNAQITEISQFELNQYHDLERKYGAFMKPRGDSVLRYNCHGMTFASRRTGIFEDQVIYQILEEDSYQEIPSNEVLAGDIILYFGENGDVEHSATVISPPNEDMLGIPVVCGKWAKYKEVIHKANQGPYNFSRARYYRVQT